MAFTAAKTDFFYDTHAAFNSKVAYGTSDTKHFKIGIIGAGYWGTKLIHNCAKSLNANLKVVADLSLQNLQGIRLANPEVRVTTNYQELFNQGLDAVVIATPAHTHFPLVRECLNHDLHVLLEKPLALNTHHAHMLLQLAREKGKLVLVDHGFQFCGAVRALRHLIASGALGELLHIESLRANLGTFRTHSNVLWDLAPHDVSMLHYLFEKDPLCVSARQMDYVDEAISGKAHLTFKMSESLYAHHQVSWLDPLKTHRVVIVGSDKTAVYDDSREDKLRLYKTSVDAGFTSEGFQEMQATPCDFAYEVSPVDTMHPRCSLIEHFMACLDGVERPLSDALEGLRVVQVLEAAQASLNLKGRWVRIPSLGISDHG